MPAVIANERGCHHAGKEWVAHRIVLLLYVVDTGRESNRFATLGELGLQPRV